MDKLTGDITAEPTGERVMVMGRIDVPSITLKGPYIMEVRKGHAEGTEDVLLGEGDYTIQVVDIFFSIHALGGATSLDELEVDLGLNFKTIDGGNKATLNGVQVNWGDAVKAFNDGFASVWNEGSKAELNEGIRCSVNVVIGVS
jgi:hypothetical protein